MSSLSVFSDECSTFLDMMNHAIGIDKKQQLYVIKKIINIAIRTTYYIFSCRKRNWDSLSFFFFFLFFFLNNSISSSICKLPIRSEIYSWTFKTQIKFPSLLLQVIPGKVNYNYFTLYKATSLSLKII